MKKTLILTTLSLLMLVGCGNNTSTNNSSLDTSSDVTSSSEQINIVQEKIDYIKRLELYETRKSYTISKDNMVYYDSYEISYFDKNNNIEMVSRNVSRINGFDSAEEVNKTKDIYYYDGFYSYTLQSDNIYLKESFKKSLSFYSISYNFEACKLEGKETGSSVLLEGNVINDKINEFFGEDKKDVSDVKVSISFFGESLEEITVKYLQKGFSVYENIKVSTNSRTLVLPKQVKTK